MVLKSQNKRGRSFIPSPFIGGGGLGLLHHSITTAHSRTIAHHVAATKTTIHSPAWLPILDLLRCEEFSSLQPHLDSFIPQLILKVSQFFLLIENGLGISLWISP